MPNNTQFAHLIGVSNPDHNIEGDFSIENKRVLISETTNALTFAGISIINPCIFKQSNLPKAPFDIWNYVLKDLIIQNKSLARKQINYG